MELFTIFVTGMIAALPNVVGEWFRTRNEIKLIRLRNGAQSQAAEPRPQVSRAPPQRAAAATRSPVPVLRIGGLPSGTTLAGPDVVARVKELIAELDPNGRYLRVERPGGLLPPEGTPLIKVQFKATPVGVRASAGLATVHQGASLHGSAMDVADYIVHSAPRAAAATPATGRLQTWSHVDLRQLDQYPPAEVVAYTVTWFVLAVTDAYWIEATGADPGLLARTGAPPAARVPNRRVPVTTATDGPWAADVQQLRAAGCRVTVVPLEQGRTGLQIVDGDTELMVVVDHHFPDAPPIAVHANRVPVELLAADWDRSRTLTQILEALR
ncbi:hypothetical protein [Micromonospora sp. NPDC005203]|uniref:hypothetical protein n=1 Tax=Micromonospora sp. NPDC005203 TaxID=3364226 RepID=UPI0036BA974B